MVIGIDHYKNTRQLKYAVSDARAFCDHLIHNNRIPEENVTLLTNQEAHFLQLRSIDFDPTRTNILRYLQFLPFAFIGTMADHSMTMLGAVYLLQLPPILFGYGIFPFMLFERTLAATVSTVIASAVLKAFEHELFNVNSE